jgi:peptidase S41-like protein
MTIRTKNLAITPSLLFSAALFLASPVAPAFGQGPSPAAGGASAPTPLSGADRAGALQAIKEVLRDSYVLPEMRPKLVERLSQSQAAGRYDVEDSHVFADRITEDLRDLTGDGHLSLRLAPAEYAAAIAAPAGDDGNEAFARRHAVRAHHGLTELRVLPGNVRYLRITGFQWVLDETGEAYDDAMRFLKDGDAVIIDLRGNGGGSAAAVQYLTSHFLGADTLLLTFLEGSETPTQSRTLNHLPAGRLKGMPLYVLIDGGVASAAEEFAYHAQQFKLGELVGAKTAGAANNNRMVPIAPAFILSVSVGRPVHAIGNTNWEGAGVQPTVAAPSEQALDVAHSLALTRLVQTPGVTPEALTDYAWARTAVEARLHPVSISPKQLQTLAGDYGEVSVAFRDGVLWLARPNRQTRRLSPLKSDGLFAVEGVDILRVRFIRKGLQLLYHGEPAPRLFEKT